MGKWPNKILRKEMRKCNKQQFGGLGRIFWNSGYSNICASLARAGTSRSLGSRLVPRLDPRP